MTPVVPVGTYTDWTWPPTERGFSSFEWDLTPLSDPTPDGYFWSHQFALRGGHAGYLGLQTLGSEPAGKIAILSIWEAVAGAGPAYSAPFGGEGEGWTVRVPFEWRVGTTYHLRVAAAGAARWEASVDEVHVGRIEVPPGWGGLDPFSIMWTERYSGGRRSCADIRHAAARFGRPTADGGAVDPTGRRHHLAANAGCPGSDARDDGDGVVHEMGRPQPGRSRRWWPWG